MPRAVTGSQETPTKTLGQTFVRVITSTDHKVIGNLYLCTSFGWFLAGGVMALLMRSELANPGMQFVNDEVYNQVFTMHGTIMLFLFATPFVFGLGNYIVPLQIGADGRGVPTAEHAQLLALPVRRPDRWSGFLTADGAADFGWIAYAPCRTA